MKTTMKRNSPKRKSPQRWFVDCDYEGNACLVPLNQRDHWVAWLEESANKMNPILPPYVRSVDDMTRITFAAPRVMGKPLTPTSL